MRIGAIHGDAGLQKVAIGTLWDGTIVCSVDGKYVRDRLDTDFVWGGHHLAYDFIPENEIWIERHDNPEDMKSICAHEILEWYIMKTTGKGYKQAHHMATCAERVLRQIL